MEVPRSRSVHSARVLSKLRFERGHRPRKQIPLPEAARSALEIVVDKRVSVTQGSVDRELSVGGGAAAPDLSGRISRKSAGTARDPQDDHKARKGCRGPRAANNALVHPSRWSQQSQETPTPPCVFSASQPPTQAERSITLAPYSSSPGPCKPRLAGVAAAKHSPRRMSMKLNAAREPLRQCGGREGRKVDRRRTPHGAATRRAVRAADAESCLTRPYLGRR